MLTPDGMPGQEFTLPLPSGQHVQDAYVTSRTGHLLVLCGDELSTSMRGYLSLPDGATLQPLSENIEHAVLNDAGYTALALTDGTLRLYGPDGALLLTARRDGTMPTIALSVGSTGEWLAYLVAPKTDGEPYTVTVLDGHGATLMTQTTNATALVSIGSAGVLLRGSDYATLLDVRARQQSWSLSNDFAEVLVVGQVGVVAGVPSDPPGQATTRALVINLNDGTPVSSFSLDASPVVGIMPSISPTNEVLVVTQRKVHRITIP